MPIPDYQKIMLPLLQLTQTGERISIRQAVGKIAQEFGLSEMEVNQRLPSGNQRVFDNRVCWARTYLKKAGLLSSPQRGIIEITPEGKKVLLSSPSEITVTCLKKFPTFREFYSPQDPPLPDVTARENNNTSSSTPEEAVESSYLSLKNQLIEDIREKIAACSPAFFERMVVDILIGMGYGGSRKDAGQAIGQVGDEGIDGIINEDRLGLDVIYIQAKRWKGKIGRPEVQKFSGALQGKRAKKGVFITTSDFTTEAREFVTNIEAKIILLSGAQVAELLWENNIGITTSISYEVKKMDFDYFTE